MSNQDNVNILKERITELNAVSPTFCLAKWLQTTTMLYNGFTHSCHHPAAHKINVEDIKTNPKALHNTPIKIVARADMLKGIQTPECDYCWKIENLGKDHFSDRHYKSAHYRSMGMWENFDEVVKSGVGENIAPTYLEIAFENICNFKCSYCSPSVSSRWMEEIQEHGSYVLSDGQKMHDIQWLKQSGQFPIHHKEHNPYIDAFWEWWPELYKTLHTFRITGGEPLLSDNTWKILDYVIANPRSDFKLCINTNMGIPRKLVEKLVDKLNQLENKIQPIIIYTSTEATGEQAEYSRHGMDWGLFTSNIKYLLKHTSNHVALHFMTTVNILSASTFDKFLDYFCDLRQRFNSVRQSTRISFMVAYLRWPKYQSITLLDDEQKRIFSQKMKDAKERHTGENLGDFYLEEIDQIERLVNFMNSEPTDENLLRNFADFFDEYDKRRGTSLLETFPELSKVYEIGTSGRSVTNP